MTEAKLLIAPDCQHCTSMMNLLGDLLKEGTIPTAPSTTELKMWPTPHRSVIMVVRRSDQERVFAMTAKGM